MSRGLALRAFRLLARTPILLALALHAATVASAAPPPAADPTRRARSTLMRTKAAITLTAYLLLAGPVVAIDGRPTTVDRPAPEFTHAGAEAWLNSPPLTLAALRGRVVLIDFWTFDCWNCYRSFPWLKALEQRYAARGLRVVGVHAPEFEHERDTAALRGKIADFGLSHPVMIDNDFSYWRALENQYWPAYYLIDVRGRLRHVFVGETHEGDARAQQIERALQSLLDEAQAIR